MPRSVTLVSLVAFVGEHRRCGVLDGGRDNAYVWLQFSCGGLIVQPGAVLVAFVYGMLHKRKWVRWYIIAALATGLGVPLFM